jgi:LPXTG-motif cell wall-anchored protein
LPNYDDTIGVYNTSDMSLTTTWTLADGNATFSCELDNDGNLIVGDYGNSLVFKVTPAGVASASDAIDAYVYSAIPSCDTIYVADEYNEASIPVLDLATLDAGTTIVPDENPDGSGFYAVNGDRSLDGLVIAISGYYSTDALVIIKSPECGSSPSPALPDTGVDTATAGVTVAVAAGMLVAGAIALVAIRRRKA